VKTTTTKRAPATEPLTFMEARDIRWKAQRGYRATAEETERLAYATMLAQLNVHVCVPGDIEQTGGLDR